MKGFVLKVLKTVMSMLIILQMMVFSTPITLSAATSYDVYEIQSNGSLKSIGSYSDFSTAETEMKKYPNGVIKSSVGSSRTGYIAMTRGVAVSYSFRYGTTNNGDVTMTIYQYKPGDNVKNMKTTYVASHNEMQYLNTAYDSGAGKWMVHVNLGGFDGYCYLDQVDLIPFIYFENNLSIDLGGGNLSDSAERFTIKPKRGRFTVYNGELYFINYSYYNEREMHNMTLGPADESWMEEGKSYYSYDYIHFYSDIACTKDEHVYYNYYMFLPMRSKSYCDPVSFDKYIQSLNLKNTAYNCGSVLAADGSAQLFFDAQETYGVNALLLYALAIHESNKGASNIAVSKYNLFGWSAYDANTEQATKFESVKQCVDQMASRNLRRYMDTGSTLFFGCYFGSKGNGFNLKYASDPYWGLSVAHWAYYLDKLNGNVDYKAYKLGVVDDTKGFKTEIKASDSSSSATVDYTNYGATYQKNNVFILNKTSNGFYQVQSSVELNDDKTVPAYDKDAFLTYDYLKSVLYISKDKINVISASRYPAASVSNVVRGALSVNGNVLTLDSFTIASDGLSLSGTAYNKGCASRADGDIVHQLVLINTADNTEIKYKLSNKNSKVDLTNQDLEYLYTGFSGTKIDLSKAVEGQTYKVVLRTTYKNNDYSFDSNIQPKTLPDLASVYGNLSFYSKDGVLYLNAKEKNVDDAAMTGSLRVIEWKEGKLHLTGAAVVEGVALKEKNKISRELVIYDVSSDYQKVIHLDVYSHDDGISNTYEYALMDEVNYYYAWYDVLVDLSDLPDGDYRMKINMTVENSGVTYNGSMKLSQTLAGYVPERITLDVDDNGSKDKAISIDKVIRELSVYEINITSAEESVLNKITSVSKPTHRNTNYSVSDFSISDSGILKLQGFLYLYGVDHTAESAPLYTLYLLKDGKIVKSEVLNTTVGLYDVTDFIVDSSFSYSHAWFEKEIDLSTLEAGKYGIYIGMEIGEYNDFFQMYDSYSQYAKSVQGSGVTYTVIETANSCRMSLQISR